MVEKARAMPSWGPATNGLWNSTSSQGGRVLARRAVPGLQGEVLGARVEGARDDQPPALDVVGEEQAGDAVRAADDQPLHPGVGGEPTARCPPRHALPARVGRGRQPGGAGGPTGGDPRGGRPAADHPPPEGAGRDHGGPSGDDGAPLHRPAAVLDQGRGVGRVTLAGEQVVDGGVEVDVERPVGGLQALGGAGGVVGAG